MGFESINGTRKLTSPIVSKDPSRRIVEGPVLVPNEEDTQGDQLTADEITELAHKFLKDYRNIDVLHTLNNVAEPVESWISKFDRTYTREGDNGVQEKVIVPKGSWWLSSYVASDEAWQAVLNGELNGYSIMAVKEQVVKQFDEVEEDMTRKEKFKKVQTAAKNGLIAEKDVKQVSLDELGDSFVVNAVSLVDEPAVPKARFVSVKSDDADVDENDAEATFKELQGTLDEKLETRREAVEEALTQSIESEEMDDTDFSVWVKGLFQNRVVFEVDVYGGERNLFQIGYEYDVENETAQLQGEPEAVEIEEVLVPVTRANYQDLRAQVLKDSAEAANVIDEYEDEGYTKKAAQFVRDYAMKNGIRPRASLGFGNHHAVKQSRGEVSLPDKLDEVRSAQKEGRTISDDNLEKLTQAKAVLDEILESAVDEREAFVSVEELMEMHTTKTQSGQSQKGGEADMDEEEVKELVSEAIEEQSQEIAQKAAEDAVNETVEALEYLDAAEKDAEGEEPEEDDAEDNEVLKRLEDLEEQVEQAQKRATGSRQQVGPDASTEKSKGDGDDNGGSSDHGVERGPNGRSKKKIV